MPGPAERAHSGQSAEHDDLEDIDILRNLLELRTRLTKEKPSIETDLD